jgi:hypothetical protein
LLQSIPHFFLAAQPIMTIFVRMVVSTLRSSRPGFGGPMPEPARAFLEGIGADLFVTTRGLTVAPAIVNALSDGRHTARSRVVGRVRDRSDIYSWLVGP